jgi:3-hydroxyisobutyrate dehydrogenase-like beta-hydroxyacid dehydrogenase
MSEHLPRIDERLAFIGFGEAAQAFTAGWRTRAEVQVCAYDIKTDDPATREAKLDDYRRLSVSGTESAAEAASKADVIVSAVTADAALDAVESVVPALAPGQLYLDINSVAPARKRQAAERVGARGADYVDVAVMAPVRSHGHRTPLLVGGPGANRAEDLLRRLDMDFEVVSEEVGYASTVKMARRRLSALLMAG